jgi:hypothetical protein
VFELGGLERIDLSLLDLENTCLSLRCAHLSCGCIAHKRGLIVLAALDVLRSLRCCLPRDQLHESLFSLFLRLLHDLGRRSTQVEITGIGLLTKRDQVLEAGLHDPRIAMAASRDLIVLCLALSVHSSHHRI